MELRQLRYFIAVAERLSFSKAARELHVTVPPLSRQVHQLEEELGAELFARDRRHVALTDAGRLLLREAKVLVSQAKRISECVRVAERGETGLVKIGIAVGLGERISRVVIEHGKRFPAVEIQCTDLFSGEQSEALLEGTIDVGFLRPPADLAHLHSELLFEERFVVHVSRASPLAKHKSLRLKDVADEPLLMLERSISSGLHDKILELYAKAGLTPNVVWLPMEHMQAPRGNVQTIFLASRKGISVVTDEVLTHPSPESAVVAVPLDEPDARIGVYAAWRKRERSAAVLTFLNSVRRVFGIERRERRSRGVVGAAGLPGARAAAEAGTEIS